MTTTSRSRRLDTIAGLAATLPTPTLSTLLAYGQDDDWPTWPADEIVPGQAIAHIRARRSSYALCNTDFVTWLVTHGTAAATTARTTRPSATPGNSQVA